MLELRNISVTIGNKSILHGISAVLQPGDFVAIVGHNGAGKSTLLELLAGTLSPSRGDVIIKGNVVNHLDERQRASLVSRLYQDPQKNSVSILTVQENLALALLKGTSPTLKNALNRLPKSSLQQETVRLFGKHILTQSMNELSGGQRQLIAFLMATAHPPQILLLDEPTAALDPKAAEHMFALIDLYTKTHETITIMVTHELEDALVHGNSLWIMHSGTIVKRYGDEKKQLSASDLKTLL